MYIYRFEVVAQEKVIDLIIVANDDESAFKYVDIELEKYYLKIPLIQEITLYEKKKIIHGGGYVLERTHFL